MLSKPTLDRLLAFRRERDWEQFHTPKNLAIAIVVESAELLEQFQWTKASAAPEDLAGLREEMADVAILLTYLAHDLGIDLDDAVVHKLSANGRRYPVEQSKGVARKAGPAGGSPA